MSLYLTILTKAWILFALPVAFPVALPDTLKQAILPRFFQEFSDWYTWRHDQHLEGKFIIHKRIAKARPQTLLRFCRREICCVKFFFFETTLYTMHSITWCIWIILTNASRVEYYILKARRRVQKQMELEKHAHSFVIYRPKPPKPRKIRVELIS